MSVAPSPTTAVARHRIAAWAARWWTAEAPSRRPPATWRDAVVSAGVVWLVARMVMTAWALVTVATTESARSLHVPKTFFTLFYHWDSAYFGDIASGGYFAPSSPANLQAFLPGYGLAGRLVTMVLFPSRALTIGDFTVGLWVAAALPSLLAAVALWKLTADRFGARVASGATVLLVFGPYSVFMTASYSEPLFLAFAVFAWYHARKGRWFLAGVLGAGASFTRIDGLFLAAALAVLYLQAHAPEWRSHLLRAGALMALALSTLVGYFAYLWAATGDPLAWLTAERAGWHRRFTLPWVSGANTLMKALNPVASTAHRVQSTSEIVFALLCIVGCILLIRRRRWGGVVLIATMMASLMTSTTFMSLSRESLLLFPLTMLVASYRDVPSRRWIFYCALVGGAVLALFNAHQFVLGLWAQ